MTGLHAMKQWVVSHLQATRDSILNEPAIAEVEFFQNERFSLVHVTNRFYKYIADLRKVWTALVKTNQRKNPSTVIAVSKQALLNDGTLLQRFVSLPGYLDNDLKIGE